MDLSKIEKVLADLRKLHQDTSKFEDQLNKIYSEMLTLKINCMNA